MAKKKIPPLVIENVKDRANLYYMSLIEYKRESYLAIIDYITNDEISAFILDFAHQEKVNMQNFLSIVNHWFYKSAHKHPLSFEIAKLGLTAQLSPLYKSFDINYISRVIGHPFTFNMEPKTKVKRRKAIPVPSTVEIRLKK